MTCFTHFNLRWLNIIRKDCILLIFKKYICYDIKMKRNNIKKRFQSLKRIIINKPDESIIAAGVALSLLLLIPSALLRELIWGDLSVNLSASMITVVLTVLLVDKLRQLHISRELIEPRAEAIRRIKISNNIMILLLSIINFSKDSGYKTSVKEEGLFSESIHDNEVARLVALNPKLIRAFNSGGTRNSLKQSADSITRELTSVRQNYDYAVDNEFKTKLNKMINAIEGLKGIYVIYDIEPTTLQSFSDADGDDFVKMQLIEYLKTYKEFVETFKLPTDSKPAE